MKRSFHISLCFLIVAVFGFPCVNFAQEKDEGESLVWTDTMNWEPPAELLAGLKRLGPLTTGREDQKLVNPQFVRCIGDRVYVPDPGAQMLFSFAPDGSYLGGRALGDVPFPRQIVGLAGDGRGRILIGGFDHLLLFDGESVSRHTNYQQVGHFAWDGETVWTLNRGDRAKNEGLIREVSHDGVLKREWGDGSFEPIKGQTFGMRIIARSGDLLIVSDPHFDGFLVLDPRAGSVKEVSYAIPALRERQIMMQRSVDYSAKHNTGSTRIFPTISAMTVADGRVYQLVYDQNFITILRARIDGTIEKVWRGLPAKPGMVDIFDVVMVDGSPRFFMLMRSYSEGDVTTTVEVFVPDTIVPTLAEAQRLKPKQVAKPADVARAAEIRKLYQEFQKIYGTMRSTEDVAEKKRLAFGFVAEHPDFSASPQLLRILIGDGGDTALNAEIIRQAEAAREKSENAEVRQAYDLLRITLYARQGDGDHVAALADDISGQDLSFSEWYTIARATREVKRWECLQRAIEKGISALAPEEMRKTYRGIDDQSLRQTAQRYRDEFQLLRGEAALGLGHVSEALSDFEAVGAKRERNLIGAFEGDLGLLWARTLQALGRDAEALDLIVNEALFSRDPERLDLLRSLYAALHPGTDFETWARAQRLERAQLLADVTFFRYDGTPVPLRETLKEVTLINFWSPST